jgi:hypothetical protein
MQIKPCKQHEIKPHSQTFFQFRVGQPMPLADQQTFKQNNLIISLRAQTRSVQTALQKWQNQRPIHKRINFAQDILIPNRTRALVDENVHKNPNMIF